MLSASAIVTGMTPASSEARAPPDEPRQHVAADLVGAEPVASRTAACATATEVGRDRVERRQLRRGQRDPTMKRARPARRSRPAGAAAAARR